MNRLFSILLNAVTVLSLLLCVGTVVLWVRSYRMTEQINWRNAGGWRAVRSVRGDVEVALLLADWSNYPWEFRAPRYERDAAGPPYNYLRLMGGNWDDVNFNWEWRSFAWHHKRNTRLGTLHAEGFVPFWSVAATTALPPLGWTALRIRSRRRRQRGVGLCPHCGYDLRATPDRCPECGAVPTAKGARFPGAVRMDLIR
jgi:hypothetical protein